MHIFEILILIWIAIVLIVWGLVVRYKPEWIGRSPDKNKQLIDRVRYEECDQCEGGTLVPKFSWWQFYIGTPVGSWVMGSPEKLECTNCTNARKENIERKWFTKISLSRTVPLDYVIRTIVFFVLGIVVIIGLAKLGDL